MNKKTAIIFIVLVIVALLVLVSFYIRPKPFAPNATDNTNTDQKDWKKILTPSQYYILREAGTEAPFSGELNHETRKGTYYSVGCDKPLFHSEQKYDSGTGWPSFWAPINADAVILKQESGLLDDRIEVLDSCGSHLGHVFDDGPQPTGKRYCMNSLALYFVPDAN